MKCSFWKEKQWKSRILQMDAICQSPIVTSSDIPSHVVDDWLMFRTIELSRQDTIPKTVQVYYCDVRREWRIYLEKKISLICKQSSAVFTFNKQGQQVTLLRGKLGSSSSAVVRFWCFVEILYYRPIVSTSSENSLIIHLMCMHSALLTAHQTVNVR